MANFKLPPNLLKKVIITFIFSIFAIQIVSLMLNSFFPSFPLFKGGLVILVMLAAVAIISLFVLAINLEELKKKENLIFVLIVFGLTIAGYYYLPKYLPQLFVISPQTAESLQNTIGAIIGG